MSLGVAGQIRLGRVLSLSAAPMPMITSGSGIMRSTSSMFLTQPLRNMNRNFRIPKKANHGARPCSRQSRKLKIRRKMGLAVPKWYQRAMGMKTKLRS